MQRTDELIERLAASAAPVHRLPHPTARALAWFGIAVPYVVLVALAMRPRADLATVLRDPRFVLQALAGVIAAGVASVAAFTMSIPGFDPWRRAALMLVAAAWFAWFAGGALVAGVAAPSEVVGWQCLPSLLVFGTVPLIAMALLLRRGAPLAPGRTFGVGALAAGALADLGTRVCHSAASDAHLVWHAVAVLLLVAGGVGAAPVVLRWRTG